MSASPDLLARIDRLLELTHQLSNSLGLAADYLALANPGTDTYSPEKVEVATLLAIRATNELRELMVELNLLQMSVTEPAKPKADSAGVPNEIKMVRRPLEGHGIV